MYNRYVPQSDGTFCCNRMPEPAAPAHPAPGVPEPGRPPEPPPEKEALPRHADPGFLRQLLGKDFDSGDLIVVLLLLLMAGDSDQDRQTAILTAALYFLM